MIPGTDGNHQRFQASPDTKAFFKLGWEIMENEDPGTRQEVITKLGAETGLAIIKTLTDSMDVIRNDDASVLIFKGWVLPFFQIISHPNVLSSLVLETPIGTIYSFLFGPNGQRGISTFQFVANSLRKMSTRHNDEPVVPIAVSSSFAVLDKLIKLNQTAQVVDGFSAVVETICACAPEDSLLLSARQSLTSIKRRLNIGSSLPSASNTPNTLSTPGDFRAEAGLSRKPSHQWYPP